MKTIQNSTNSEVQIFSNPKFGEVRVTVINDEPMFAGIDVARALGYEDPKDAVQKHVDEEEKRLMQLSDFQQGGELSPHLKMSKLQGITEGGVYSLIFGSKLERAKEFKKWVCSDVLPSIRKYGGYMASHSDDTPELIMARALKIAQQTIERHTEQLRLAEMSIKEQAPKVEYCNNVLQSTSTYTTTQVAKELGMSAYALEKILHEKNVIFKQSGQWLLYAKYQNEGYTKPRTHHYTKSDGTTGSNTITVWTELGRKFIHELLKNEVAA